MLNILSLPHTVLIRVIKYLMLKDLLSLGDSHNQLREVIYKSPEIWTTDLLFPIGDNEITDKFIQRIVPRITRHYGILELKMMDLPLSWFGYLLIFDQFAHSVNRIEIKATLDELNKLSHHLSIFAGNLAMLQQNNKIPITFRQYAFDDEEEFLTALSESNFLGQCTLHNLNNQFASMELDDPPFERLKDFNIIVSSGGGAVKGNGGDGKEEEEVQHIIHQLKLIAAFLSGQTPITASSSNQNNNSNTIITPRSSIPSAAAVYYSSLMNNNKRSRDAAAMDESASSSSPFTYNSTGPPQLNNNNKHTRYDYQQQQQNNAYYHHQSQQQQEFLHQYPHHQNYHQHDHQQQSSSYHHHHHHFSQQKQQHQESQESQQPAKRFSSSFA